MKEEQGNSGKLLITLAAVVALAAIAGVGLYALFPPAGKSSVETQAAASTKCAVDSALVEKLDAKASGQMAAFTVTDRPISVKSLSFSDAERKTTSLQDWAGRTVLLNLWATWCAPCRAEMPALEALNRELSGEAFEVVPVSVDLGDDSKPKAFYAEIGLRDLPFFHDADLGILNELKSQGLGYGLPTTLLIDGRGCVLGVLSGPAAWESDDAKALIRQAL